MLMALTGNSLKQSMKALLSPGMGGTFHTPMIGIRVFFPVPRTGLSATTAHLPNFQAMDPFPLSMMLLFPRVRLPIKVVHKEVIVSSFSIQN